MYKSPSRTTLLFTSCISLGLYALYSCVSATTPVSVSRLVTPANNTISTTSSTHYLNKNPFIPYTDALVTAGIITRQSTEEGYNLGKNITRAEIAKVAVNLKKTTGVTCTGKVFSDVSPALGDLCGYIEAAAKAGLVNSTTTKFRPTDIVTRAEALKMLLSARDIAPSTEDQGFKDLGSDASLNGYINAAAKAGIINKTTFFNPNYLAVRRVVFKIAANATGLMPLSTTIPVSTSGDVIPPITSIVTLNTTTVSDKSNSLFEKVTVTEYNGVSVDVLVDSETSGKIDKQQPVNVIVAYRGTTTDASKILEDSEKFIAKVKMILPAGNNLIVSVVYPEGEKIAGGNIKDTEAGLLWVKNRISGHLGIALGKVLLVGHSQGGYLVAILNTLQQTDGVVSNSPGPLDIKLLCERVQDGTYTDAIKTFTCDTYKKHYGSVTLNPEMYTANSLLSFVSGYKAKTLFVQGMMQTGIQIELWPLFKKSVQSCSNCAKAEFLDVPNGTHTAGFFTPDAIAREKAFLDECIKTPASQINPTSPVSSTNISQSIQSKIEAQALSLIDTTGKAAGKTPGMVVGVITKDFTGSFGFGTKVINTNQKPDGDTFFDIGSVSKVFTSLILADEVSQGNLRLDQKAADLVQGPLKTLVPASLTLGGLVTHTSGLKSMPENIKGVRVSRADGYIWWAPARNYEQVDLYNCLQKGKCMPNPNNVDRYMYSNLGISILGMALQDKLGLSSFDEMLKVKVSNPLGMADTSTNIPAFISKVASRSASGYGMNNGVLTATPHADMGSMSPAGEIITTSNDLLKFMAVLTGMNPSVFGEASTRALVPLTSIDATKKVGYAIEIEGADTNSPVYSKSGGTPGFSSYIIWKRNPQIGIIILTNKSGVRLPTLAESLMSELQ